MLFSEGCTALASKSQLRMLRSLLTLYSQKLQMSLYKIPFLLAATWLTHVAYTPPNPPASKEERTAQTGVELLVPVTGRAIFLVTEGSY